MEGSCNNQPHERTIKSVRLIAVHGCRGIKEDISGERCSKRQMFCDSGNIPPESFIALLLAFQLRASYKVTEAEVNTRPPQHQKVRCMVLAKRRGMTRLI